MTKFKQIKASELPFTPFDIKDREWMLITAEKDGKVNTMTASWGGFGIMWNKEVAFIVIRPQRYTKEFVDGSSSFSLSFLGKDYKKTLSYLGTVSGRDEDKIAKSGLTAAFDKGVPYFEEAHTVLFVEKLYMQPMSEESFIDRDIISRWFPEKDFHYLYVGEVKKVMINEISKKP
ncbi:MAG: flavin reductase [Prevotella sp.]|jgi:flavin reductase (DIM6/NTAB) family NADH-FMN oxidoreductase RutF|nr:flavin reductase [Prevotella sp.]